MPRPRTWIAVLAAPIVAFAAATSSPAQQPSPQQIQEILQQVQQNPEHFQRLLQQANDMQACLSRLAPDTLDRLRMRGEEMVADLRALCVAGERDMAASRAAQYAQEMAASPDLRAVGECGSMASQLMADLPFAAPEAADGADSVHVCDQLAP